MLLLSRDLVSPAALIVNERLFIVKGVQGHSGGRHRCAQGGRVHPRSTCGQHRCIKGICNSAPSPQVPGPACRNKLPSSFTEGARGIQCHPMPKAAQKLPHARRCVPIQPGLRLYSPSIRVRLQPGFRFYSEGVYVEPKCGWKHDDLDHSVTLVGYGRSDHGTDYWHIRCAAHAWHLFALPQCGVHRDISARRHQADLEAFGAAGSPPALSCEHTPVGPARRRRTRCASSFCHHHDMRMLRNSWSTWWGDEGYVKISREGHACGVATNALYGVPDVSSRVAA